MSKFEHNSDAFGYINLEDLDGVQTALAKLGYDPGDADGKNGPKTQHAVKAFQKDAGIGVDGIPGPETQGALVSALDAKVAADKAPTEAPPAS